MLNRENAVIAYETERGNKVTPILLTVARSRPCGIPRTVDLIAVILGIENMVRSVLSLSTFVSLGMNVVD